MSVERLTADEADDLINALTKAVVDLRTENAALKSERDVAVRALEMASDHVDSESQPRYSKYPSNMTTSDIFIQQAREDLQK